MLRAPLFQKYKPFSPAALVIILAVVIGVSSGAASPTDPLGDINSDSVTNAYDLSLFVSSYGKSLTGPAKGDLDNNGVVNDNDFTLLKAHFRQVSSGADNTGSVRFVLRTGPSYDQYTSNASNTIRQWINNHLWRMEVFTTYFDDKTSWYPNGWVYKDSYSIGIASSLAGQHPEWILKDLSGNKLYTLGLFRGQLPAVCRRLR